MKLVAAAASLAVLRLRPAQGAGIAPLPPWKLFAEGQPNRFSPEAFPPVQGTLPQLWTGLSQGPTAPGPPLPTELRQPQTTSLNLHQQPDLVQQRAVSLEHGGAALNPQPAPLSTLSSSAPSGMWRASNTSRALQELLANVERSFGRSEADGFAWGSASAEVVIPVQNVSNALIELSKFLQEVLRFCETEAQQKRMQGGLGGFGHSVDPMYGPAVNFPVNDSIAQAMEYGKRASEQMRLLRDLIRAVWMQSSTKATVMKELQRFNMGMAHSKEVYQQGSQVSSALAGAVLPYLSTCSFFNKANTHEAYRLWFLVGARINSAQRYLHQALEMVRKVAARLPDLVAGKIQPQSLQDFARSKPFYRAAGYLESAQARSASAVSYFNELALAYNAHTQSSIFLPEGGQGQAVEVRDNFPKSAPSQAASHLPATVSSGPTGSPNLDLYPEVNSAHSEISSVYRDSSIVAPPDQLIAGTQLGGSKDALELIQGAGLAFGQKEESLSERVNDDPGPA